MDVFSDLPFLLLLAIAIVPLHRAILTGPPQLDRRIPFRLGRREARYFLFVAAISIVYTGFDLAIRPAIGPVVALLVELRFAVDRFEPVADLVVAVAALIIAIPIIAAVTYVPFRLSLTLPAVATDREKQLSHAWVVGRGNGWRLVAVLWIAVLPIMAAVMAFEPSSETMLSETPVMMADGTWVFMPEEPGEDPSFVAMAAWETLAYTAMFLVEGAALSLSYRALGGLDEAPTASP